MSEKELTIRELYELKTKITGTTKRETPLRDKLK